MQTWEDEKTHLKKFQSAKKMIPNFDPRNQIDRPKKWESGKNNLQKIFEAAIWIKICKPVFGLMTLSGTNEITEWIRQLMKNEAHLRWNSKQQWMTVNDETGD